MGASPSENAVTDTLDVYSYILSIKPYCTISSTTCIQKNKTKYMLKILGQTLTNYNFESENLNNFLFA